MFVYSHQFFSYIMNAILLRMNCLSLKSVSSTIPKIYLRSRRSLSYFLPAAIASYFGKFTESFIGTEIIWR